MRKNEEVLLINENGCRPHHAMTFNSLGVSFDLLQILLGYASEIGLNEKVIVSECQIDLADFRRNDTRVPMSQFHPVWRYILGNSNDPDFGLHFGVYAHRLLSRHLLYAMMMNCNNVEQAIRKNFLYHNLLTDLIKPSLRIDKHKACLSWELAHPEMKQERHFSEAIMSLFVAMLNYLTDNKAYFREARFVHTAPDTKLEHQAIFNCPLFFDQKRNEIFLDRTYLKSPILMAKQDILADLERLVQKELHRAYQGNSWMEKVAGILTAKILKEQQSDIRSVARSLAMTERNLQLKLKEEGITFRKLADEIRKEIAIGYLKNQEVTLCDIALLLGFSEQSSFQHAFKRWTGKTPGAFRHPLK